MGLRRKRKGFDVKDTGLKRDDCHNILHLVPDEKYTENPGKYRGRYMPAQNLGILFLTFPGK